jgi:hypothetical protein
MQTPSRQRGWVTAIAMFLLLGIATCGRGLLAQPPMRSPDPPVARRVYPPPKPPEAPESRLGDLSSRKKEATNTTLEIDLFMSDATQALQSQTWGRVFDALGYRVRVKSGGVDDKPQLKETRRGPLRTVQLVGRIDRKGTVTFPGKTFQPGDEKALREWLEELEAYGAQGSPVGQPRWGLSTDQFQALFTSLAEEVQANVKGEPLVDVARSLGFGIDISLRVDDSVDDRWTPFLTALQDVRGISRGSALAVLLNDHGLCFRPLRTPAGSVDLVLLDKAATADPWPLGWEPRPDVQRSDYAPGLFVFGSVGFLERPLPEVFEEARQQTDCPIVVDHPALARKEIDLAKRSFGLAQKKTAWVLVLPSALAGTGLKPHIRVDEAGQGFVLVSLPELKSVTR